MFTLRQILNRVVGTGPWSAAPFAAICNRTCALRHAVHRPEAFDGVLRCESGDFATYTGGQSILSQPDNADMVEGRNRYCRAGIAPACDKVLYSLSNGGIVGTDGLVYSVATRTAIQESMRCWTTATTRHPVLSAPRLPLSQRLDGCGTVIAVLGGEGYFHFLLESLPRLWIAREHLGTVQYVFANGRAGSFHERWLERAGVSPSTIVWVQGLSHFHCEQLLFSNYLMCDAQPTRWTVLALRQLLKANPSTTPGNRRLWISRADTGTRQPAWEAVLLRQLPEFEKVTLTDRSPAEQIEIMRSAAVVAGPTGAGLSNIVFCSPGTKLIELHDLRRSTPLFSRLADVCEMPSGWAAIDFSIAEPDSRLASAIRKFSENSAGRSK